MKNGVASSAQEALKLLRKASVDGHPYKLAMIDFVMPEKNGMDLAREILADPSIRDTRLILLTAFDAPGLGIQAVNMGFRAYLTKPVRQSQMFECLSNIMSGTQSITCSAADRRVGFGEHNTPRKELILIAEDHVINQQVAELYLKELGFTSQVVSHGGQAVEAASSNDYSLILMDCQMPGMDGFTATEAIRKMEETSGNHIPIIAVTANAMLGDRERCLEAGMDDYISKPIDPAALRTLFEKWLPFTNKVDPTPPIDFKTAEARYGQTVEKLLRLFVAVTPPELLEFNRALAIKDRKAMLDLAHGLKGVCTTISALQMRSTCTEIECAAQIQNWEYLKSLILRLEQDFGEVERWLEQHTALLSIII